MVRVLLLEVQMTPIDLMKNWFFAYSNNYVMFRLIFFNCEGVFFLLSKLSFLQIQRRHCHNSNTTFRFRN